MDPSSCASVWIEAINASSIIPGSPVAEEVLSVEPEGDGCLEVASAARLLLPGRCVMSNAMGGYAVSAGTNVSLISHPACGRQRSSPVVYGR